MPTASDEIDAIIRNADDWRGELLGRVRAAVLATDPAIVEEVKWKKPSKPEGVPVWSLQGIVCIGEMLKNAVRVTFPKGAQLDDPASVFNARLSGNTVRAIDLGQRDDLPAEALKALVRAGIALNAGT